MGQQIANALGYGVGALSTIQAIRSGQFQNQAIQRSQALADPNVRAGLINSPFTAGTMFVGGGPRALHTAQPIEPEQPPNDPAAPSRVNVPQQFAWTPSLGPLSPGEGIKQSLAQSALDTRMQDPALAAAQAGQASPEQAAALLQRVPRNENDVPVFQNMTFAPGGIGMYQQNLPWPYMARNIDQGLPAGQFGNLGRNPYITRPEGPTSLAEEPSAFDRNWNTAMGPDQNPYTDRGVQSGMPGERGVRPLSGGRAAAAPAPAAAPAAAAPPPDDEGFQTFDVPMPSITPSAAAPAGSAQPPQAPPLPQAGAPGVAALGQGALAPPPGEIGFPPTLGASGGGPQGPQYTPVPSRPEDVFGPASGQPTSMAETVTTPHGQSGSKTVVRRMDFPNRQELLDKAMAKGLSDTATVGLNAMLISADGYRNLLNLYAPIDPQTGKRNIEPMRRFIGRYKSALEDAKRIIPGTGSLGQIPYVGGALGILDQDPEYQQFKSLVATLSANISQFAGKAITDVEKKLFEPFLIGSVDLTEPEFWNRFTAIGRVIGRFGRDNSLLYAAKIPPELRDELRALGEQFPPEQWGLVAPTPRQ